ncbi:RimK/LysX family protein [Aliagarivorans taiwanensis]|uniref:putative ATP-dependent zinc protease n=1 Tax=Aliagarivorans taiwanensis TaxID=561966 RepID=UPI00042025B6|nr:RimK/LysX family protein [Aliagarivorans taiwanensis]
MKPWWMLVLTLLVSVATVTSEAASRSVQPQPSDQRIVLGRTEFIHFPTLPELNGAPLTGKIDTGAETTSMHAEDIHVNSSNPLFSELSDQALMRAIGEHYGKVEDSWWLEEFDNDQRKINATVSFTLVNPHGGERVSLTKPLARLSLIKGRGDDESQYRPVVRLELDIGGKRALTDINLTDRSRFSYPVLIGKSYLADAAWVDAGADYLGEQAQARMLGRQEKAWFEGMPMNVSYTFSSRHSMLHAMNVVVDEQAGTVSFSSEGTKGKPQTLELPLYKMLNFSNASYPMVYIPVYWQAPDKAGAEPDHLLVYLKDRSKLSSQLRLGLEAQAQHYQIALDQKFIAKKDMRWSSFAIDNPQAIEISNLETLLVDGQPVTAEPATGVNTPLLDVSNIVSSGSGKGRKVSYLLTDNQGQRHERVSPQLKRIAVGKESRPVIDAELQLGEQLLETEVALQQSEAASSPSMLRIGRGLSDEHSVVVNVRREQRLALTEQYRAGYIEQVELEGMSFPAKLDTGADVSSVHADHIERFQRNGEEWVRFSYRDHFGNSREFTKPVKRIMRIRARAGETAAERPVVELDVKLGPLEHSVEVNLQDRSRFEYPMILGKNFLRHGLVVGSNEQFLLTEK